MVFSNGLAVQDLDIPNLPYNANIRLDLELCRLCVEEMEKEECNYYEEQRSSIRTFRNPELHEAIIKGYKVLKAYDFFRV